jgi:4-aminobutyrate aminotransferase
MVQAGVGKTGKFWSHEHFCVRPDVLVAAKGLASGFPLSAIVASRDLMERGRLGSQGGTYGGNAVACAAALATLDVIEEEGLVGRAAVLGQRLQERLREAAASDTRVGDVRGLGLMVGTEFTAPDGSPDVEAATRVLAAAKAVGLLLLPCGTYGNVLRWVPPLVVTTEQIEEAVAIFQGALEETASRA